MMEQQQQMSRLGVATDGCSIRLALFVSLASMVFPWPLRRWLLQALCKYSIAHDARIGYSIVACSSLSLGPAARIGHGNVVKGIELDMAEAATIGDFNWISGLSLQDRKHFVHDSTRRPVLRLGRHAALTSRHFLDCSNTVDIGEFSTIAGIRSQVLTHAIDILRSEQASAAVRIGRYCFIGTGCVVLKGARLPDFSVLAANSSLVRSFEEPFTLYSGVPATAVKGLDRNAAYFHRSRGYVD